MSELQWIVAVARDFTPAAAGVWTGVLMFAAYLMREWRETRKLSADDRMARREGYAKQLENLQGENRALAEDSRRLREEYDGYRAFCQKENDNLRNQVIDLQFEVAGVKRQLAVQAIQLYQRTTPHAIEGEAAGFPQGDDP